MQSSPSKRFSMLESSSGSATLDRKSSFGDLTRTRSRGSSLSIPIRNPFSQKKKKDSDDKSIESELSRTPDSNTPQLSPGPEPILWGIKEINVDNIQDGITFVKFCVAWLRKTKAALQTGIFRKAGNEEEILAIRSDTLRGIPDGYQFSDDTDPHVISSVFKRYFREFKNPLLTHQLYTEFIGATSEEDDKRLKAIRVVLGLLPEPNKQLLHLVCEYLNEVAQKSDVNMMSSQNLAIVFAPNFLRPEIEKPSTLISDAGHAVALVQTFIDEVDTIFTPVPTIVTPEEQTTTIRADLQKRYTLHRTKSKEMMKKYVVDKKLDGETWKLTLKEVGEKILEGDALLAGGDSVTEIETVISEIPLNEIDIVTDLDRFAGIRPNKRAKKRQSSIKLFSDST